MVRSLYTDLLPVPGVVVYSMASDAILKLCPSTNWMTASRLARLDVGLDTYHRVERRCVRLVDVTVAFGYVVYQLFGEVALAQNERVHAEVGDGVVCHDHKRRNVVGHPASPLISTHSPMSIFSWTSEHDERIEKSPMWHERNLDRVAYHHGVSDHSVVGDVRLCHYE